MSYVKHPPHKEGSRQHVKFYVGRRDWKGDDYAEIRCSEPKCELNAPKPRLPAPNKPTGFSLGLGS